MTYQALLIGNSVFDADAGLNPLNAPVKDVARLHRALVDADTGLFDDDHVRLVTERACDDILDELDRFFSAGRKDDLLLLYYSGHGLLDERNRLYLCGRDTRSDRLLRTAVSNVRVNEFVAQSMCQRTVIVLDCCSSGMFKGGPVGAQMAGPGRYIVSSTRGADLANDAVTATGTSLFTEHLVEGLLGAAPDTNEDGFIDLREIYDYVRDCLLRTTKQVPHCRFDGDAALSMARVRNLPRVARAASGQRYRLNEPTFALAENIITLRDVELDEQLRPEVVEVIQLGDAPLDLVARTDDEWLTATVSTDGVIVVLRPQLGRNRGKITIRDQASGSAQVLRVEAHVRPAPSVTPAVKSGPADASAAAPVPAAPPERQASGGPDPAGLRSTGRATTGEVAAAAGASAGYAPPPPSSYAPPAAGYTPPPTAGYPPPTQPPPAPPQQFPQGGQWYPAQPAALWTPVTPYGSAPQAPPSPPGPQPHHLQGTSGPRPVSAQSVNVLGLGIAGLGALLLIIAFSGVSWYKDSNTGATANVSQLQNGATQAHATFAEAFFNGLGWLLIVATVAAGVLACLPIGPAQNWLRRGAVALGLFSIALMLVALDDLWTKVRDVTGQTDVGVWSHTDSGLGLALWGFALAGCGGLIRRRRRGVPSR